MVLGYTRTGRDNMERDLQKGEAIGQWLYEYLMQHGFESTWFCQPIIYSRGLGSIIGENDVEITEHLSSEYNVIFSVVFIQDDTHISLNSSISALDQKIGDNFESLTNTVDIFDINLSKICSGVLSINGLNISTTLEACIKMLQLYHLKIEDEKITFLKK